MTVLHYIILTSTRPIVDPTASPTPKNTITILEAISFSCCSTTLQCSHVKRQSFDKTLIYLGAQMAAKFAK